MSNIILYNIDVYGKRFSPMAAGRDGVFFALVCNGFHGLSCTPPLLTPTTLDWIVVYCHVPNQPRGGYRKYNFGRTVFHDLQQVSASSFPYSRSGETIGRNSVLLTL